MPKLPLPPPFLGPQRDPIIAVRDRAYDLASTGEFKRWRDIVSVLQKEGCYALLISRLDAHQFFQISLQFRIKEAKRRSLVASKRKS